MLAHRRRAVALANTRNELGLLHQPDDTVPTRAFVLEIGVGRYLTESATRGGRPQDATMAKRISVDARRELVRAIGERYREAAREDKPRILDEFVPVLGYHRKHSIRVYAGESSEIATLRRGHARGAHRAVGSR